MLDWITDKMMNITTGTRTSEAGISSKSVPVLALKMMEEVPSPFPGILEVSPLFPGILEVSPPFPGILEVLREEEDALEGKGVVDGGDLTSEW